MDLPVTLGGWLLAFLPLGLLLFLMVFRRWGAAEAGPLSWLVAAVIAVAAFGMELDALALETVRGSWNAVRILYVVWAAILIYEVTREADAFEPFRRGITRLIPHPLIQVMAFGWAFASFLQGVSGFGVPIAVAAPLLVGIGVRPLYAVIIPLVGHAWNNTFGTLAVAWLGLREVTGMPAAAAASTALYAASFVWLLNILGGLLVCYLYGRWPGIREGLPAVLAISLVQGGLTLGLAPWNDTINGFVAGVAGFVLLFAVGRLPRYRRESRVTSRIFTADVVPGAAGDGAGEADGVAGPGGTAAGRSGAGSAGHAVRGSDGATGTATARGTMSLNTAFIPYHVLLVLTFGVLLVAPVKAALDTVAIGIPFPEMSTRLGFEREATTESMTPLTHAGTFLLLAAALGYAAFRRLGHIGPRGWRTVLGRTAEKAIAATIAVIALVAMSTVLQGAGAVFVLAEGVAVTTGDLYAFLAPAIGLLGAFMTGSNLASNLLFGSFQQTTAQAAGLNQAAILGAQTAGGATGNIVAPSNVLLGTTTAGILGREGEVLRVTIPLALAICVVIGAVVLLVS